MDSKTIVPISEARRNIFQIANRVQRPSVHYTLTENGRPKAVIMSAEEFDSLMETVAIAADPRLMREIKDSAAAYRRGDSIPLEAVIARKNYVPRRVEKISRKRSRAAR